MKITFFFLPTFLVLFFIACKNDPKPNTTETTTPVVQTTTKDCKYGVHSDKVKVVWTAFKTTKRVGVKGTFDDVQITTASNTPNISTLIHATSFMINTKTVNSNNEERDAKLSTSFFGHLSGNMAISGNVKSVEGNNEIGTGILSIKMNGISKDAPYTYKVEGETLILKTVINTDLWSAQSAIIALNKVCKDMHTGEDGVTKTWADVSVEVEVPLVVICK